MVNFQDKANFIWQIYLSIVKYLDGQASRIDNSIEKAEKQNLIKEYCATFNIRSRNHKNRSERGEIDG